MTEPSADQGHHADDKPTDAPSIVPDGPEAKADHPHNTPALRDTETVAESTHTPGADSNLMILWPDRGQHDRTFSSRPDATADAGTGGRSSTHRRRRLAALGAVASIAAVCGAVGGALATVALEHMFAPKDAPVQVAAVDTTGQLRDALAHITADVTGLRADVDHASKLRVAQLGKLGDRLDKVEKAQDDTAGRVAKLGDAQEKADKAEKTQDRLRATSALAAPETTGSIGTPASGRADQKAGSEPIFKKPTIVDGWNLARVTGGGAIVDGPDGLFEAYPGDPLPGLGRVDAVRYQDGRWVVVTPKGLIVHR